LQTPPSTQKPKTPTHTPLYPFFGVRPWDIGHLSRSATRVAYFWPLFDSQPSEKNGAKHQIAFGRNGEQQKPGQKSTQPLLTSFTFHQHNAQKSNRESDHLKCNEQINKQQQ